MTPATPTRTAPSTRLRRLEDSSVIARRSVLRAADGNPQAPTVDRELLRPVRVVEYGLWRQRQIIGQQLSRQPVTVSLEPRHQARVAGDNRRDPIADLVAGRLAQALQPVAHLPRQSFGLELRRQARVERDQQLALLCQLVTGPRPGNELEFIGLEDFASRLDATILELVPIAGARRRHDRRHGSPPPRPDDRQ